MRTSPSTARTTMKGVPSHASDSSRWTTSGTGTVVRARTRSSTRRCNARSKVGKVGYAESGAGASRATSASPSRRNITVSFAMPLSGARTSVTAAPSPRTDARPRGEARRELLRIASPRRRDRRCASVIDPLDLRPTRRERSRLARTGDTKDLDVFSAADREVRVERWSSNGVQDRDRVRRRCAVDRERRRPRDRTAVAVGVAPARALSRRRATRRAACRPASCSCPGARYVERPGTDGPLVDYWVYGDLYQSLKRAVTAVGSPARRHDDDRDHVRRRATRLLRPGRTRARHGHELDPGVAVASPTSRGSADRRSSRPRTASSRCSACARTTTGWSTSGAPAVTAGSCRCASSRSGIRNSPRPRSSATPRAACGRSAFRRFRRTSGLPSIHSGEWDPFFAACEATGTVLCLHIGSGYEDAVDVTRRAARRHRSPSGSATA